jgi:ornithine--oxo-acid transaminase
VPFGDADALDAAITPNTAAFLVEPVQGEAGIIVPPAGYLKRAREICTKHGILLICDEVQTGLGRTGALLACDHEGIRPDGLVLGKALGGGLVPVSAFLASDEVMAVFHPGDHGSTFGGNPLAAAVGIAALDLLVRERLSERARVRGDELLAKLREIDDPAIAEVRGKGLLIGVEIDPRAATAREVCEGLLARGVLSKDTHGTVVRFAPPLIVESKHIDLAVEALADTLRSLR